MRCGPPASIPAVRRAVAILRREAGRDPHDKGLHDLIGELSTRSEDFRTRWGAHNVRRHGRGTKRFRPPSVGDLTLAYESLDLAAEPGLTMTSYTAEPGSSPSEEGLRLLASLAATEKADAAAQRPPLESAVREPSVSPRSLPGAPRLGEPVTSVGLAGFHRLRPACSVPRPGSRRPTTPPGPASARGAIPSSRSVEWYGRSP